jgi:tRNA threonylcarbamoyladenosine biosynthesis protein TsaB
VRILAIDTATQPGSVAIADDDRLEARVLPGRDQALAATVAALVPEIASIDAYAIAIGPGSFTGLRVGLAFLKGLSIAHKRPVATISTLAAILERARRTGGKGSILALLDARAGEVYAQRDPDLAPGLYAIEALAERLRGQAPGQMTGDRVPALEALLPGWTPVSLPEGAPVLASVVADLARPMIAAGEGLSAGPLEPVYLQLAAVDRRR